MRFGAPGSLPLIDPAIMFSKKKISGNLAHMSGAVQAALM